MYNDARRMILGAAGSLVRDTEGLTNPDDALIDVKTLLLLEIYGLCSGDRRSYELTEAHHLDLQLVSLVWPEILYPQTFQCITYGQFIYQHFCWPSNGSMNSKLAPCEWAPQNRSLLKSLYTLDLYRVVIVQRPPIIPSYYTSTWVSLTTNSGLRSFLDLVDALSTPGAPIDDQMMNKHHFGALASLNAFVWPVLNVRSELDHAKNPLWNADFAAACCDKWLRAQGSNIDPPFLIMYHTTSLMLHVDILLLQRFAARTSHAEWQGQSLDGPYDMLRTWVHSGDHQVALWHARGIFHNIETIYGRTLRRSSQAATQTLGIEASSPSRRPADAEAPHVPYGTYFATIVLCASASLMQSPGHDNMAYLTKGKHFLSQSRLRIAQLLHRVLDGARWPSNFPDA